jgi:hypothetical protein
MAEYGFKRALTEVIMGLVLSYIVSAFVSSGLIPPQYKLLFDLINVLAIISLIQVVPYWGTAYLLGWLIGMGIMIQSGILEVWEFLIYLIIGIVVLTKRFLKGLD